MIAPKELRIGNIVWLKSKNKEHIIDSGYEIDTGTDSDDFEPIELSEDWLYKFGFEKKADHSFILKVFARSIIHAYTHGKVEIELGNMSGYSFGYPQVYYVHQFQNLYFALTGDELKIKE